LARYKKNGVIQKLWHARQLSTSKPIYYQRNMPLAMAAADSDMNYTSLKGTPTYRSPKVKGCTDIYVNLTYTGTETDVSFGLFIPEIHFFWQG